MLTIRADQMAVFEAMSQDQFREKLAGHAWADFAQQAEPLGVPGVDKLVEDAITRGKVYGIVSEKDVSLFFDLFFLLEPGFDLKGKPVWIKRILLGEDMDGTEKMEAVYKRLAALEKRESSTSKDTP